MTAVVHESDLAAFAAKVRADANAQYTCPQHVRLFAVPLTLARARLWLLQQHLWTLNRRDCWAAAQSLAPIDVKRMIWDHERDELEGNAERGVEDHRALSVRQGGLLDLTPADFAGVEMREGTRTCTYAWLHLVRSSHWLKSVSACAALEISNSSEWVDGGGMSLRRGKSFERQLGIPFEKQVSHVEHAQVDVEHAHLLMRIAKAYGSQPQALDLMLEGLRESWQIERVWKSQIAEMMEAVP